MPAQPPSFAREAPRRFCLTPLLAKYSSSTPRSCQQVPTTSPVRRAAGWNSSSPTRAQRCTTHLSNNRQFKGTRNQLFSLASSRARDAPRENDDNFERKRLTAACPPLPKTGKCQLLLSFLPQRKKRKNWGLGKGSFSIRGEGLPASDTGCRRLFLSFGRVCFFPCGCVVQGLGPRSFFLMPIWSQGCSITYKAWAGGNFCPQGQGNSSFPSSWCRCSFFVVSATDAFFFCFLDKPFEWLMMVHPLRPALRRDQHPTKISTSRRWLS